LKNLTGENRAVWSKLNTSQEPLLTPVASFESRIYILMIPAEFTAAFPERSKQRLQNANFDRISRIEA